MKTSIKVKLVLMAALFFWLSSRFWAIADPVTVTAVIFLTLWGLWYLVIWPYYYYTRPYEVVCRHRWAISLIGLTLSIFCIVAGLQILFY